MLSMPMHHRSFPRNRLRYALITLGVVASGLLWRSGYLPLPEFASKYGGDALWALMVFTGLGCILTRTSTLRLAATALCCTWLVEFSQLYHAPWIDTLRATLPGRLILGSVFNWPDLPAYAVGIATGAAAEFLLRKGRGVEQGC